AGVQAPVAAKPAPVKASAETEAPKRAPARKMSFKDKHRLERLPAEMASFDAEIRMHQETLADPGLYARDPSRFAALTARLSKAQELLAAAEAEWLALELLRETLEG